MRIRDFLILSLAAIGLGYLVYDAWLRALIDPVPAHVWQLAGWTWFSWAGWFSLQRLTR